MKIGIILAHENSPYAGVVRPFINWGKYLEKMNIGVEFLLFKTGKEISNKLNSLGLESHEFFGFRDLNNFCKKRGYDFVFADDYIERLKIIKKIKGGFGKIVYVHVLFGTHNFSGVFKPISLKEKILFLLFKMLPFFIIRKYYNRFLKNIDIIIANSYVTASFLQLLYNVRVDNIIYPPVDTKIFKPQIFKRKDQVLVYMGSNAGDTDINFINDICKSLQKKKIKIFVLGNDSLIKNLEKEGEIEQIKKVSDNKLAEIYSESLFTICPQKWEQFGYVVAESIACGTPVLAFNYMGPKEIIEKTKFGLLFDTEFQMLKFLKNEHKMQKFPSKFKNKIEFPFDNRKSSFNLIKTLKEWRRDE